MTRRGLLIAGLAALTVAILGAGVQASTTGNGSWWPNHMLDGNHMFGGGHRSNDGMPWWGDQGTDTAVIDGARGVSATATEFGFAPSVIEVTAGEPINLTLVNDGSVTHDLVIRDLGIRLAAGPGRQTTTGIQIDEAGTYEFLCTLPGHAAAGMTGVLEVQSG